MASLNQLVSEIVNSVGQPNNHVLRENVKLSVIHIRNELIRHSYEQHGYVDKGLMQRYRVSLTDVLDGDINLYEEAFSEAECSFDDFGVDKIKRTEQQVPRPVRLTNNLPFSRVSTAGFASNREFPFIKETSARFRSDVPGLCGMPAYDYINGFIYIFPPKGKSLHFDSIIIESAFEHPTVIDLSNGYADELAAITDDNEWLLPEDMIGQIKDIIFKRDLLTTFRETNEIPNTIKF